MALSNKNHLKARVAKSSVLSYSSFSNLQIIQFMQKMQGLQRGLIIAVPRYRSFLDTLPPS